MRDASRVRIQLPLIDDTGDGSPTASTDTYICLTGNFNWTGFSRQTVRADCSENTLDAFGNLVAVFQAGREIDMGSISFDADWSPAALTAAGGRLYAAFKSGLTGDYKFKFPAAAGESAGPVITIPGFVTNFNPMTNVMGNGDESRSRCNITIKIAGDITITPAT